MERSDQRMEQSDLERSGHGTVAVILLTLTFYYSYQRFLQTFVMETYLLGTIIPSAFLLAPARTAFYAL